MKSLLGVSALAVSALALAAPAFADGNVDASYISLDPSGSSNLDGVRLGGAGSVGIATNWTAQFDATWTRLSDSGGDVTFSGGAAHATYHAENWALGGYANVGDLAGDGIWGFGAEGRLLPDRFSIGGSIGYDSVDNTSTNAWDGDISAKYFVTDNLSVGGHYGHVDVSNSSSDFNIYGASAEWKANSSPIGVFASYDRLDVSNSSSDANLWQVGARWHFNTDTLLKSEHTGASWARGNVFTRYVLF